jgi:tetratricopeptide (TPR) repeat protein
MLFSKKESSIGSKFDTGSYFLLIATILILPIAIGVQVWVPPVYAKIAVGSALVLIAFVLYAISRVYEQEMVVPRSLLPLFAWLIPVVYLLSALFSSGQGIRSLFGERLSIDSFAFMAVAMLTLSLVTLVVRTQKRALGMYLAFLTSAAVLSVIQLLMFFARQMVAGLGITLPVSLLGSLNDLTVFFGLIIIFVLLALILLPVTPIVRAVLWLPLLVSGFFLAIANLQVLWWVLGLFALGCLVYTVTAPYMSKDMSKVSTTGPQASIAALVVLILAAFFLFGAESITRSPAQWANVGELDVRPSWRTTIDIGSQVLHDQAIFGSGPGSFARLWAKNMPAEINTTQFWQTDFLFGIGFIPTSILSTGILGALAWLVFLGTLLWCGLRVLVLSRRESRNSVVQFFRITSFVGTIYLWAIAVIQVPSPALILYACILTGLFVASTSFGDDTVEPITVRFQDNPRVGFVIALLLTVGVLLSIGALYGVWARYTAETNYARAILVVNTTGKFDEGQALIEQAINRQPTGLFYRTLSTIDLVRIQQLLAQGKQPKEIVTQLQDLMARSIGNAVKATELDGNDYQNWLNLGSLYQSIAPLGIEGSLDSAQAAFDRALALRPNSPVIYYAKADIDRQKGNKDEAKKQVERAIKLRSNYTDAIFLLAQLQLEQNDVANAIKSVEAVTLFEPSNAVAFFQLGLLEYGTNDFVKASVALEHAVTLNPVYANARYFLGLSDWRMGKNDAALAEFRKVQETNQDNAEVGSIIKNLEAGRQPFATTTAPVATSTPAVDIKTRKTTPIPGANAADTAATPAKTENLTQ